MKRSAFFAPLLLLASGCWTFNESPYPAVQIAGAPEKARTVNLAGFEATLTEWEALHGYRTVYVPGYPGRHHFEPGYFETVPSIDYVPQRRATDMFLRRAQDTFEKAGFTLAPLAADLTVEVHFEGPIVSSGDETKRLAWNVFTIFFCDWGKARWTAQLRIRESKTGRLVFHHDYDQSYETGVFGLLPLFCASSCESLEPAHMQSWCLAALTDRACADATAYISSLK